MPAHGIASLAGDTEHYAGGEPALRLIEDLVRGLRRPGTFPLLCQEGGLLPEVSGLADRIRAFVVAEDALLDRGEMLPDLATQEAVNLTLTRLKDAAWAIEKELAVNVQRVRDLMAGAAATPKGLREYRKLNLILNAIDRLEIRGRDSAGVLVQVTFPDAASLSAILEEHQEVTVARTELPDLPEGAIALSDDGRTASLVYKVSAEVGKLGDNVAALRSQARQDAVLPALLSAADSQVLVAAHTRWASNGIINVPNCHPLDNDCAGMAGLPVLDAGHPAGPRTPRVYVALNGDIDNYLELKQKFEEETGRKVSDRITTDAKVIALWVDHYLRRGENLEAAFRLAVRDFEGSAAILMTSDLEPGRLYLSLKGSGQSLYVGLPESGYVIASEIYGLVEETDRFVKLEGERERVSGDARTRGQVFILDPGATGHGGIRAGHHDGVAIRVAAGDVRPAGITTRDVDRGDFPHYFLKEVSQAADSVAKTIRGKFSRDGAPLLGRETIPDEVSRMLAEGEFRRIFVVGQGTASIAAMAAAAFIGESLRGSEVHVDSMKASELSGFNLEPDMSKTLVIAVTQSGATADTNRAVDLARERGAQTIAIVNRRNSDITFKTAGVLYTSDGRDVEMSVASTKAFYSQVVAGAVLGLAFGRLAGTIDEERVRERLEELRDLPLLLREVFKLGPTIERAAERCAPRRRYWTVVGSGPNRIAAEEVRIKLSELCYKSISADSVEDKKHIDLSSESMILVLAAGNNDSVLADLAKDVAIFKAHSAMPVVFATAGDRRFDEYAAELIELPAASPLLSMVMCTMAGHLFGYHAARSIDEGGKFLGRIRMTVVDSLDRAGAAVVGELSKYGREFHARLRGERFASALEAATAADLMLLLKYGAGQIPPASFLDEYGRDPSLTEIHAALLQCLVRAIDQTIRPIDAIKHQAKIVTVGTSRPSERPTGVVFDALASIDVPMSAITFRDRGRLKLVQPAIAAVTGLSRYAIAGLEADGSPGTAAKITATGQTGSAAGIPSRAVGGARLKGTKRSVVQERRAFLGVGAKDGRRIAIIPLVDHRFTVNALALLHLDFKESMTAREKVGALGESYDDIVNGVTEADVPWSDELLDAIPPAVLFTTEPTVIARRIVETVKK
jgi:glucosamine--fructose-6-phosphate aminotransferase (isomerizing)